MLRAVIFSIILSISSYPLIAAESSSQAIPLAPGYGALGYALPAVGSYNLPVIAKAKDAVVTDEYGRETTLYKLFDGKYALLSFMYTRCSDVNGCPLSAFVMYSIKSKMRENTELAKSLKMISMSFDPENDTPAHMKQYGKNFRYAGKAGDWRFITTTSIDQLRPVLTGYDQDLQRKLNKDGDPSNDFSHLLRVFLIDPDKNIRNIYSVAFLHAELIERDFATLKMQENKPEKILVTGSAFIGPGDQKDNYDKKDYQTNTRHLESRIGQQTDLVAIANNPGAGLPTLPVPEGIELNTELVTLGKKLFFDRRLSLNNTFSCAMCHIPEQGFTSNELATAVGIEGRTVKRNTPTLLNIGYVEKLFHDGREDQLSQQVWGPLLARNEMGNPSVGYVVNKIKSLPVYPPLFTKAFGTKSVGMQTIGDALAAYQLTLVSGNSRFDQWKYSKKSNALSEQEKAGYELFSGKAACSSCHSINDEYALFSDNKLHNTGMGYKISMQKTPPTLKVQLAPGVFTEIDSSVVASVSEKKPNDLGLYEITENPDDRWRFRTPTLRNVALTSPYMHNGSLSTLREVIEFYNHGGVKNELLSPLVRPLGLSGTEMDKLEAFLHTLTGDNIETLVSDAFHAEVGDISTGDALWTPDSTH